MSQKSDNADLWLHGLVRSPVRTTRLLLLPPAGAGVSFWKPFQNSLANRFGEILALRAPGRESRFTESPLESIELLVSEVVKALPKDGIPLTIFGHSMGAVVGFEVARRLHQRHNMPPQHLIVSGRVAPHRFAQKALHTESSKRLKQLIRSFGGTVPAVFDNSELWDIYEPAIRADLKMVETYTPQPHYRLPCLLTALSAHEDPLASPGDVAQWNESAGADFRHLNFSGHHFFVFDHIEAISDALLWPAEKHSLDASRLGRSESSRNDHVAEYSPSAHWSNLNLLSPETFDLSHCVVTDDAGLVHTDMLIETTDGPLPAYYARPIGEAILPLILVIPDIFGLHPHIRDVCLRLAKIGYIAIAPALHIRANPPSPESLEELVHGVMGIPDEQVIADLDATTRWAISELGAEPKQMGVTGFCWGGRFAWIYAARRPTIKAGVAWYGRLIGERSQTHPEHPLELASNLQAPVLGLYGGKDELIPMSHIEMMRERLIKAAQPCQIVVYPDAPHAFFCDTRSEYHELAAKDGWCRLQDWFRSHLHKVTPRKESL